MKQILRSSSIFQTLPKGWKSVLILFGLVAVLSLLMIASPDYKTSRDTLAPPGTEHWLGTNDIGQDVLSGVVLALPNTIIISVVSAGLALMIALVFALVAAIYSRTLAAIILRMVDIAQIVPSILLILLLAAWFQPGFTGVILILALIAWYDDVRVLRAIILRELTRENVQYARQMQASWSYCARYHIIPAIWPSLLALYVQNLRQTAMKLAGLGFLGLTDPRLLTWGSMMQDALNYMYEPAWSWLLLPPALCLTVFLLCILFVGQRLERYSLAMSSETS